MRASDVMHDAMVTVRPDAMIREAAQMMDDLNVGALPVCDGRRAGRHHHRPRHRGEVHRRRHAAGRDAGARSDDRRGVLVASRTTRSEKIEDEMAQRQIRAHARGRP